jgi:hypothetical protein
MLSNIKMVPPPFETPMIEVKQFWHRRFHSDTRSMWYRGLLMSIFRNADFKAPTLKAFSGIADNQRSPDRVAMGPGDHRIAQAIGMLEREPEDRPETSSGRSDDEGHRREAQQAATFACDLSVFRQHQVRRGHRIRSAGASMSPRSKFSDQLVDDAGHGHGGTEVEFVDRNEGANPPGWRERGVGEHTLQTSGLL